MIVFNKVIFKIYKLQNKPNKLKHTKIKILITIKILFSKINTHQRRLKFNKIVNKHNIHLKQKL